MSKLEHIAGRIKFYIKLEMHIYTVYAAYCNHG
jgi:hypothetical protein